MAGVGLAGLIVFGVVTPRMRLTLPRILQDVLVAGVSVVAVFSTASRAGVNLSGIVATGAVLTAVIGLALQDTLGNVVGGLSMQLDSTIRVGDWIRVQDVVGRVVEIRWRSTSIETRNWETVIIPNTVLTRTQVMVLGRRMGEEPRWRRWVYFNVDYRYPPTQVIGLVTRALHAQPIENVAATPEPNCVLMDFQESSARYAVRYHLQNLQVDDPTDSVVRTRVYYALTRAGIPLAIPAHTVFMTEDSVERRTRKREADSERRVQALSRIAFFRDLSDAELDELAESMHPAPFAPGEVLTRQGAEAHHLYIIDRGRVSVRVRSGERDHQISELGDNEFFGEMSLLTGEKRAATVVALTDVECYRLDAAAFRRLLEKRPDLATKVAEKLAERRVELVSSSEALGDRQSMIDRDKDDLLHKIREFFGL
jgi:small-conductance mechanosensitive channel